MTPELFTAVSTGHVSQRNIILIVVLLVLNCCDADKTVPGGLRTREVNADDVTPETTLNTYLRDKLHLTGTKKMCLEGGCGTCIVAVEELDADGNKKVFAVNSCLVSIFSCHGWKILSNEGIGNPLMGYNKLQKILADNNGSQCGFCSSGMVMNMYALTETGKMTEAEIENSFGGNLCRCTGYRPILTAFKKLAIDAEKEDKIGDLEDLKPCTKTKCQNNCAKPCNKTSICYELLRSKWMKVYNLTDLLEILRTLGTKNYMLVAGNTARGVFWPIDSYSAEVYVDITGVVELTTYKQFDDCLTLGANMNLTDTMNLFRKVAKLNSKFAYLDKMATHIDLVAHVPVRNIGSLAGNLMMKHKHNDFPSDIFLIMETADVTMVIVDVDENETRVTPMEFLNVDMDKKVIKEIILPSYDDNYYYTSYKIMPRAQNAHAMGNAGFLFKLNSGLVESARIVYGAINPQFVHATKTEKLIKGQQLFDNQVLQRIFKSLDDELDPDWVLPDPKPAFRKKLAINLLYKCVLSLAPESKLSPQNKSGATLLTRPVSNGTQTIYSKEELYPLTEPVLKLEALAQTSGQAEYLIDIPDLPGQLHAVFVKAQAIAGSVITSIDPSKALQSPGVVAFFSAKDIPGENSFTVKKLAMPVAEELFCSGTVQYFSQPVGIIVATTHENALNGSSLVTVVTTAPTKKPLFSVQQVLQTGESKRITHQTSFVRTDVKTTIKGKFNLEDQYHFHMENQVCLVVPTEDGLNIHSGTQWMDHVQSLVSQILNMPSAKISVFVRRLGGGFGAKIVRNGILAGATALAASKLLKPVRMWMNISDNMDIIGKRFPCYSEYTVAVNGKGVVQSLTANLYTNYGIGGNEPVDSYLVEQFKNCYVADTWSYDTYTVQTDIYAHCYTRAPGTLESMAAIENIMDQIAYTLNLDPLAVRRANMDQTNNKLLVDILDDILNSTDIAKRKANIETYNKANKWKKKGLSVIPMKWVMEVIGNFTTLVSIYHVDGGVAISHGGIEMGQGINTKAAQVCAYKFGIPLEKISVKPSYNVISANTGPSGGSLTSEGIAYTIIKACDMLLERMKPIRDKNPNVSWEDLVQLCHVANICLSSNGFYSQDEVGIEEYPIYACCALELEVDILTGKHEILRADILEDVGQSMSPLIDIGQLEGAFVMGLGYHSTEELVYDSEGQLKSNRTWTYKPYGAKDIPQEFNVRFSNNSLNPVGVLKSKAIAEPPTCLAVSFPLAIRNALASTRKEASPTTFSWYPIDGPTTVEQTLLSTLTDYKQYTL